MKKDTRIALLIIAIVIIIAGLFAYVYRSNNWSIGLQENDTEPYDLHVFYNAIRSHSDLTSSSPSRPPLIEDYESGDKKTIVLIDRNINLSDKRMNELLALQNFGHDVFIIGQKIEEVDGSSLIIDGSTQDNFDYDSLAFTDGGSLVSDTKFKHWRNGWVEQEAASFSEEFIAEYGAEIQLSANGKPIWISISDFEGGQLHLLSFPLVYSNFYLKQDKKLDVLQHFVKAIRFKDVVLYPNASEKFNVRAIELGSLSFIRDNPALFMASIILLLFLVLFLFFGGKRKQQSIPLAPNEESSFVRTSKFISPYYKNKARRQNLEKKLIFQFDNLIYASYGINLQNCTDKEVAFVANKLNTEISEITEIQYALKLVHEISKENYLNLNNKITKILNQWKK